MLTLSEGAHPLTVVPAKRSGPFKLASKTQGPCRATTRRQYVQAAAVVAAPPTAPLFRPTGVPLLAELQAVPLPVAVAKSVGLMGITVIGAILASKLLAFVDQQLLTETADGANVHVSPAQVVAAAVQAAHRPATALLPFFTGAYLLTVLSALVETATMRVDMHMHYGPLQLCGHGAIGALKVVTQLLQDTTELFGIVFAAWFALRLKDKLVSLGVRRASEGTSSLDELPLAEQKDISRAVMPLSTLAGWGIVSTASLAALSTFGVDVRPILTIGGASTLAVGLAAQSTVTNLVAALSLYTTRPFVMGDRVQLRSLSGSLVAAGMVTEIKPMRTCIMQDSRMPIYISNKDVAQLVVVNESQSQASQVTPQGAPLELQVTMRYQDTEKVPEVTSAITDYLKSHPDIDPSYPCRCSLTSFTDLGPQVTLKFTLFKGSASRKSAVQQQVLLDAERVVRQVGSALAMRSVEEG